MTGRGSGTWRAEGLVGGTGFSIGRAFRSRDGGLACVPGWVGDGMWSGFDDTNEKVGKHRIEARDKTQGIFGAERGCERGTRV